MDQDHKRSTNTGGEITLREFLGKIGSHGRYITRKWWIVAIFCILGVAGGLAYSVYKKPVYTAICTFVLEDGDKGGALGQYAGLASLAGIDIGGGGGGLFQGDNILELYKSRTMIERTLLSEAEFDGKKELLIDRYVSFNNLLEKWKDDDDIPSINFQGDPDKFNRKQDSIITDLVWKFNKKNLVVSKLDKKLSIIVVQVSGKDELFDQQFTKKLVETVNKFYVQTKTKKSVQNVVVLQHQADSVKAVLNSSIGGVASAIDAAPNANPQLLSLRVPSQRKQIDVQASTEVYAEVVKNLEIAKISLREDVPLIQLIDQPVLPLENDHIRKPKAMVLGFIFGFLLIIIGLTLKRIFYSLSR